MVVHGKMLIVALGTVAGFGALAHPVLAQQTTTGNACNFHVAANDPDAPVGTPPFGIGPNEAVSFQPGGEGDGKPSFGGNGGLTVFYEPFEDTAYVKRMEVQEGMSAGVQLQSGGVTEVSENGDLTSSGMEPAIGVYCVPTP